MLTFSSLQTQQQQQRAAGRKQGLLPLHRVTEPQSQTEGCEGFKSTLNRFLLTLQHMQNPDIKN